MDKFEFFSLLDEQGSAREWITEWLAIKNGYRVETPLNIVYLRNNKIEILDYLDLSRKNEVWGIEANGFCWKNAYDLIAPYDTAIKKFEKVGTMIAEIPAITYFEHFSRFVPMFNDTVKILNFNGISAEGFKTDSYPYATNEGYNKKQVQVFNAHFGAIDIVNRKENLLIKIGFPK